MISAFTCGAYRLVGIFGRRESSGMAGIKVTLLLVGVHSLFERNAELLADGLKLLQVLLVLSLVLNLELNTCGVR